MKNFSTVSTRLAWAVLFAAASSASAAPPVCAFRADAPDQHVVVKGDTLSAIAKQFYGRAGAWRDIFEANRDQLDDPDRIFPGQVLKIPAIHAGE